MHVALWLVASAVAEDAPSTSSGDAAPDRLADLEARIAAQQEQIDQQAAALAAMSQDSAPLRLYGFVDMGVNHTWVAPGAQLRSILPTTATTFAVGHINLYFDAHPAPAWRSLVELRLTNYPAGNDEAAGPGGSYEAPTTRLFDVGSPDGPWSEFRYGMVGLERAYVEWRPRDEFGLRVGQFLTPFGVWNADHGSPTLIPLMLPNFQATEMYPSRQVGIDAFGQRSTGPARLAWHLTVSNGRTAGVLDPTEDKMIGGRVAATLHGSVRATVGASAMAGRYSEQSRFNTPTDDRITVVTKEEVAYNESIVGADLALDAGDLRIRSELAWRKVVYLPDKRALLWDIPGLYDPDHYEADAYALAAYQLPWLGIEPYLYFEGYRKPNPISGGWLQGGPGVNIHFAASAQLKIEYLQSRPLNDPSERTDGHDDLVGLFAARLVLAF